MYTRSRQEKMQFDTVVPDEIQEFYGLVRHRYHNMVAMMQHVNQQFIVVSFQVESEDVFSVHMLVPWIVRSSIAKIQDPFCARIQFYFTPLM